MPRALPRTLYSLSAAYQRDIAPDAYEVIVVDNGSTPPVDPEAFAHLTGTFRFVRIDDASSSPAAAINRGLAEARGDAIGVMIDGARLVTPGLINFGRRGVSLHETAVVTTLGWYLGLDYQGYAAAQGFDEADEDALLASIGWPQDGYRLFDIGAMDQSSIDGWFASVSESNALFLRRAAWDALGGADERFDEAGGGLLNLDLYGRACRLEDARVVVLLGEATFHQRHGGTATEMPPRELEERFQTWADHYRAVRGYGWEVEPRLREPIYVGTLPGPPLRRFVRAALAPVHGEMSVIGHDFDTALWTLPTALPDDRRSLQVVELGRQAFRNRQFATTATLARFLRQRDRRELGLSPQLAFLAPVLDREIPFGERAAHHVALARAHCAFEERDDAAREFRAALEIDGDETDARLGLAELRAPGPGYLDVLERAYDVLDVRSVLEIGVFDGASLARIPARAVAIGVDPQPRALTPLRATTHIFAETSDTFFARCGAKNVLHEQALSAAFIDGLHLFEQSLRDFINVERLCDPNGTIFFHDTWPLDGASQTRERQTAFHTGDVWRTIVALRFYRPDLDIATVATAPSGLTIVRALDPSSTVLADDYDEIVARYLSMTYESVAADLESHLRMIPNDAAALEKRLRRQYPVPSRRRFDDGMLAPMVLAPDERTTVDSFHDLYYEAWHRGRGDTIALRWLGCRTLKCPMDLWTYQELLFAERPDFVVETGTRFGGSALFVASVFDAIGHGRVITIDVEERRDRPQHPRISYVSGSSVDADVVASVYRMVGRARAMVVLDSDHRRSHVMKEMLAYEGLLGVGDYLIVEDTNVNGHPTFADFGPGPHEAVEAFLALRSDFERDRACERFLMTLNPGGFLKRVAT